MSRGNDRFDFIEETLQARLNRRSINRSARGSNVHATIAGCGIPVQLSKEAGATHINRAEKEKS
jgi:hypothetical protein